ncbi:tetratricopeptide repeat protein [Sorangium sp. So ce1128]
MSENAKGMAALGESLRQEGNYSGAIECFNKAINAKGNYWWAYAHRAAARSALGDHCGALEDFRTIGVSEFYMSHNPAWFLAQKGELFRLWAMAATSKSGWEDAGKCDYLREEIPNARREISNGSKWWYALSTHALGMFCRAIEVNPDNCWALAHRGATHTMRYWMGLDTWRVRAHTMLAATDKDRDKYMADMHEEYDRAKRDFETATRMNPTYGWVYLFLAILHATRPYHAQLAHGQSSTKHAKGMLQDMDESVLNIGKAQMCGLKRDLSMVRTMMELAIYKGGELMQDSPEGDAKHPAEGALNSGVQLAWQLLQIESDEAFARYFVANGLKQLATLMGVEDPMVPAAIRRARAALEGMTARCLALSGGLDCLEGKRRDAQEKLKQIQELGDLQALTIVSRDPAWAPLRSETRPAPALSTSPADMAGHDQLVDRAAHRI